MSAFAAFKSSKQENIAPPKCLPYLLDSMASGSTFTPSFSNIIFKNESIVYGLKVGDVLIVKGIYIIKALLGNVCINNIHRLSMRSAYRIFTNTCESLPTISCNPIEPTGHQKLSHSLFPDADAVVEITNLDCGLSALGEFYSPLKGIYYHPLGRYTFELVLQAHEPVSSVHFNSHVNRNLNRLCRELKKTAVFGVSTSGKSTVARTLVNCALLAGNSEVAYLDLDFESSCAAIPGCLSLTIHEMPVFGSFTPAKEKNHPKDLHCYFGLESYQELPRKYLAACRKLISHYNNNILGNIPLIVKYPSCIKGFGRKLLLQITEFLQPDELVYLSHRNAVELERFEAEIFEAQDNPDTEVLVEFRQLCRVVVLPGTRRASEISKRELLVRNKLLYFHRNSEGSFEFQCLLESLPLKLSFDYVSAFCVITYDLDESLLERVDILAEASIMGLFSYSGEIAQKNMYIRGSDFDSVHADFLCLCMVHSVDRKKRHFNIYLPNNCNAKFESILSRGNKLILARGEGKIPIVDMIPSVPVDVLPYIDSVAKKRVGSVWKPRRGISRKNQG